MRTAETPDVADAGRSADAAPSNRDAPGRPWPASVSPAARRRKVLLSLRVDDGVLAWFRAQGPGYQTRMNAVLRAYMDHAEHASSR